MKRINIMVDEETMALLRQYKSWGKPHSWMVRYAIKAYERSRVARTGGQRPSTSQESQESTYEEPAIQL